MNLRQLAKLAGLSPSGVSLALRDSPRIAEATRARIKALAVEHGYVPDAKMVDLMRQLRKPANTRAHACFGVISFYDSLRPWTRSPHLTGIYDGMKARATELGYRLEPMWLAAPGLSLRRFAEILDARGIEGLLCFGSPDFDQKFPAELNCCAVVTMGLSIATPLHRVTSHFHNDTVNVLNRVHARGYRRPGLVLGTHEARRSAHAQSAAYLGWCEHTLGPGSALPILRLGEVDPAALTAWRHDHAPDVILYVHLPETITPLRRYLDSLPPNERPGIAVLSHLVEGTNFAGLQQNQRVMGAWAVELLAARIANRDFGIPSHPRIEMVEGEWVEGPSLRARGTANTTHGA